MLLVFSTSIILLKNFIKPIIPADIFSRGKIEISNLKRNFKYNSLQINTLLFAQVLKK